MLSKSEFERKEDTDDEQMVAVYKIDEGHNAVTVYYRLYIFSIKYYWALDNMTPEEYVKKHEENLCIKLSMK